MQIFEFRQKVFENLFIFQIMKISTLKVNGFMTKNDENGTTKCFKKTPLILKDIFYEKSMKTIGGWIDTQ